MDKSLPSSSDLHPEHNNLKPPAPHRGTFYFLEVVLSVAFIVATLFTAWTPASLLPDALAEKISQAISSIAITPSPEFPTQTPKPSPRIGIVSGHWGNDSGAVCSDNLTEAEVNLSIATKVKDILSAQGYVVDILKEFDPKLEDYQALALISIHADSCDYINDLATGFKVAAAQSNPHPDRANRLVACLLDRYSRDTGLQIHDSVTPDMSSYHAFDEINVETTAAIIEVGFLNLDRQILTQGQDTVAKGITDGIMCFLNNENISNQVYP
jgi:N-acetylmuramoyl-L-alanine amidase